MSATGADARSAEEILGRLEIWGQRLGLDRIREVLTNLGDPQSAYPVVLVAGTNGKGSTCALLASILGAAGYRVGLYSSPHLEAVEERIRVGGRCISAPVLGVRLEAVLAAARGMAQLPTYFETMTAAGFQHFAAEKVDVAVVEVGLGGRLDATNASEPSLSVITQIALDHEEQLGPRLVQIAGEKAGIMRSDRRALCWGSGHPAVRRAFRHAAEQSGARLLLADQEIDLLGAEPAERGALGRARWRHRFRSPLRGWSVESTLVGAHQSINVALAVRAAELLREQGFERVDDDAIEVGVGRCRWPGRLEWVWLSEGPGVLLDGAHNEAGIRAVASYLDQYGGSGARFDVLYGALSGKHAERSLPLLLERCRQLTLTEPDSPRAVTVTELEGITGPGPSLIRNREAALDHALQSAREGVRPLLVCGSLYLVGEVRSGLRRRYGVPEAATEIEAG